MLGIGMVNIRKGFKWKANIMNGVASFEYFDSPAATQIFRIICGYIPPVVWVTFLLMSDALFLYYLSFVAFSFLGVFLDVAFFAFHVIDIAQRIKLLGYVLRSVVINGDKVLVTLLLGAVLMWMYSVFGVYVYGFNQYSFGASTNYVWGNTLYNLFIQHLDFGLRSAPYFNDYNNVEYSVTKYIFDISYDVSFVSSNPYIILSSYISCFIFSCL
jgi:hypothetical protein